MYFTALIYLFHDNPGEPMPVSSNKLITWLPNSYI